MKPTSLSTALRLFPAYHLKKLVAVISLGLGVCILTLMALTIYESRQLHTPKLSPPLLTNALPPLAFDRGIAYPKLQAQHVYVFDPISLSVLHEKQADTPVAIASITKLMTALVVLKSYSLSNTLTLPSEKVVGSSSNISARTTWSVEQLLYALLVSSGNDAAVALAQAHPEGYEGFVQAMNDMALELNLSKTHFNNVSGLDSTGHTSSARDVAFLTLEFMRHPLLRHIVSQTQVSIQDVSGVFTTPLYSTNLLLYEELGVIGVKTGKTEAALECLVTWVERDNHPVLLVVLGSTDRFGDTRALIEWVYANFEWIRV